jgi:hypothetical protein
MTLIGSPLQSDSHVRRSLQMLATGWALTLALAALVPPVWAAGITITNEDRNKRIDVRDARIDGSRTTLLYSTRPVRGQAHMSEKCAMNFYLLELQQGLSHAQPNLLTENYCASGALSGTLLANNDVLITDGKQIETWRLGAGQVNVWPLSGIDFRQGRGNAINAIDVARNGRLVIAKTYPRKRKDTKTASGIVVGLSADGTTHWQLELHEPGVLLQTMDVWASEDGGALLHVTARPMSGAGLPGVQAPTGAVITGQNRLYRLSARGKLLTPIVIASTQMMDISKALPPLPDMTKDPDGYQAEFARRQALTRMDGYTEGAFLAHALDDATVDVLMGRNTKRARFLRIGRDGSKMLDVTLSETLAGEGLTNWIDFSSTPNQLILFGTLGTRKDRLGQGFISWIAIPDGNVVTRLAPLSELGLKAAKNAGDEQIQYLEHNPSHQLQMLTSLAGKPLTVSLIYQSRRQAMQLDEGNEELTIYTEARDERQAKVSKMTQRKQRRADREKRKQRMNHEMASAVGMSPEEYAALSNKEKKEAMIRRGDMDAMMAMIGKQAQMAQQQMPEQQAGGMQPMGQGMTPEMIKAMKQAQQAMAKAGITLPNMPNAANMQGTPSTPGIGIPAVTSGVATASEANTSASDNILRVDAGKRGFIEFENPDNNLTRLVILDRKTSKELLKKEYADGVIYEYVDFTQFNKPLGEIAVLFKDADGRTLKELTPAALP